MLRPRVRQNIMRSLISIIHSSADAGQQLFGGAALLSAVFFDCWCGQWKRWLSENVPNALLYGSQKRIFT